MHDASAQRDDLARGSGTPGCPAACDAAPSSDGPNVAPEPDANLAGPPDGSDTQAAGCVGLCDSVAPSYPAVDASAGQGNITMYTTEPSSGGACNYGVTGINYFAAMSVNLAPGDGQGQWQKGRICGQCVEVTAQTSQGPRSVVVRIVDKCPDVYCGIDLGGAAPVAVMADGFGRYDGSWRFVSCAGHPEVSDGSPSLYVSAGSNAYWSRVQIRNPATAVDAILWQDPTSQGMFPYASDPENTFEVPQTVLASTASMVALTVRYTDGSAATVKLSPSQLTTANASYPLD